MGPWFLFTFGSSQKQEEKDSFTYFPMLQTGEPITLEIDGAEEYNDLKCNPLLNINVPNPAHH